MKGRTVCRYLIPLICVPLLVLLTAQVMPEKMYAPAAVLIAILSCVLISLSFDRHTTHVRNLVLIAVMTSMSVISRFVFAAIPAFKPMTAIIVLTAMYLGKEAGFLCGAFTALISNMYFGQGPWTPFQMFSFGILGYFAGILSKQLKKHVGFLVLYGVLAGILYSFIMDIWTVLWAEQGFQISLYLAALATAVPYTVSYAVSNVIFLLLFRKSFDKKMNRICRKYLQ